jgi:hypothetical protein
VVLPDVDGGHRIQQAGGSGKEVSDGLASSLAE